MYNQTWIRWTSSALIGISLFFALFQDAQGKNLALDYKIDGVPHQGYLAIPEGAAESRPAVLIVHDWMGPGEFTEARANDMAKLGYVALAADIYGKEVRPKDPKEAGAQAGKYKGDVKLFRKKLLAALELLKKQPGVDPKRIVVFGYCFGGSAALEIARTGTELAGVVSIHGNLGTPNRDDNKKIKAPVLVLHGAIDPYVPAKEITEFVTDLDQTKLDYQFISYSGAVHAFTNPKAGNDISKGAAYNELAAKRSWRHLLAFLEEKAPVL